MLVPLLLLALGFALLLKGADWLVDGSSALARRLGVSELLIGLTVVAFGTSMPELMVNIVASIQGNADVAFGNIIGSNIANLLLILGVAGVIAALPMKRDMVRVEIPLSFLAALLVLLTTLDGTLSRLDGLILFAGFAFFLWRSVRQVPGKTEPAREEQGKGITIAALIIGGLAALIIGGKLTVDSAVEIARTLGVSEALIALTIVAVGTSLPELATSAVAAFKGKADLAVGNVVGSNIFNILAILAVSAAIRPIAFNPALVTDVLLLLGATALLGAAMYIGKKHTLERWQGAVLVAIYAGYVWLIVARG